MKYVLLLPIFTFLIACSTTSTKNDQLRSISNIVSDARSGDWNDWLKELRLVGRGVSDSKTEVKKVTSDSVVLIRVSDEQGTNVADPYMRGVYSAKIVRSGKVYNLDGLICKLTTQVRTMIEELKNESYVVESKPTIECENKIKRQFLSIQRQIGLLEIDAGLDAPLNYEIQFKSENTHETLPALLTHGKALPNKVFFEDHFNYSQTVNADDWDKSVWDYDHYPRYLPTGKGTLRNYTAGNATIFYRDPRLNFITDYEFSAKLRISLKEASVVNRNFRIAELQDATMLMIAPDLDMPPETRGVEFTFNNQLFKVAAPKNLADFNGKPPLDLLMRFRNKGKSTRLHLESVNFQFSKDFESVTKAEYVMTGSIGFFSMGNDFGDLPLDEIDWVKIQALP